MVHICIAIDNSAIYHMPRLKPPLSHTFLYIYQGMHNRGSQKIWVLGHIQAEPQAEQRDNECTCTKEKPLISTVQ